jgi:hypothetical protein
VDDAVLAFHLPARPREYPGVQQLARLLAGVAPIHARDLGVALQELLQHFFVALFRAHCSSLSASRSFESA